MELHSTSQLMKINTNKQKQKVLLIVIISNMKAKGTKIKIFCLKNILI